MLTPYPSGKSREQWEMAGAAPPPGWVAEMSTAWSTVFRTAVAIDLMGVAAFCLLGRGEPQSWDM